MGKSFSTNGTPGFHLKTHGLPNSKIMLPVWKETSSVASRNVAITTKTNFPMEDPLTESDDPTMNGTDTTVKTQLSEPSKSPLDTENGPNDTSLSAPVNVITSSKSTEWKDGTTNSRPISSPIPTTNK